MKLSLGLELSFSVGQIMAGAEQILKTVWALFKPQVNPDVRQTLFYTSAFLIAAALTFIGILARDVLTPIDQALLYLSGVVLVATWYGQGPSFVYSLLSVVAFNFFFIPPLYTFDVYDRSYWLTFAVMLMTSFVISGQATRLSIHIALSRQREEETEAFYAMTRELASTRGHMDVAHTAGKHISLMLKGRVGLWLPDADGRLYPILGGLPRKRQIKDTSVLQWVYAHGVEAGRETETMPSAAGLYVPLISTSGILGVLGFYPLPETRILSLAEVATLKTSTSLLTSAIERANFTTEAEDAKIEAERERLRTMLLSSVSHDLRTPLASITGASSTIVGDIAQLSKDSIRDLAKSIHREAERLSRIVSNLLDVTRFESGSVVLNSEPYFVEELIGSSLAHMENRFSDFSFIPKSEENLPLVLADGVLVEQVLTNLLENALRYAPLGSAIEIATFNRGSHVVVRISDEGPGIVDGEEKRIFDKFISMSRGNVPKGTGLGLAICAAIIKAHKGEIWAENGPKGGACFSFTLPVAHPTSNSTLTVSPINMSNPIEKNS